MNDLRVKLDNLLHDRRLTINLIAKLEEKKEFSTLTLWDRWTLFISKRTKRELDREVTGVFNKMSTLTSTKDAFRAIRLPR